MNNTKNTIVIIVIIILCIVLIHIILSKLIINSLNYNDIRVLKGAFSPDEIKYFRECTNYSTNILLPCYKEFHTKLIKKIKHGFNLNYLTIGQARFSNSNNHDGKSFHRDIKPRPTINGEPYPNIYTIVCYLDPAIIQIGKNMIHAKPGDIIMFNTFYLHRSLKFNTFKKQRRILQFFDVIIDNKTEIKSKNDVTLCSFIPSMFVKKYVYNSYFDIRLILEYFNLSYFAKQKCDNSTSKYAILINRQNNFLTTIEGVDYYEDI